MNNFTLPHILEEAIKKEASDVHIVVEKPPVLRIDGRLSQLKGYEAVDHDTLETTITELITPEQKKILYDTRELGFVYHMEEGGHRFRVNIFWEQGNLALAARLIPSRIPTMEEIEMPQAAYDFANLKQGLVLVTGQTGMGKSTTLAAMIDYINHERAMNIITYEDPIEFVFESDKSIIRQRELGSDAISLKESLKYVVRHDPDIIMIGELRDPETITTAITLAETGHLVFSTLHTFNAPQTIHRIIDFFPSNHQEQIRFQLAITLKGIISQQLIPRLPKGRAAAREILVNTAAVANLIRGNKIEHIESVMQTSADVGMITMDQSLKALCAKGAISSDEAQAHMTQDEVEAWM